MTNIRTVARGLGWFGIGLGLVEVLAPRSAARATGLQGHEALIQIFGLREIAAGAVILTAEAPEDWLWTRVAGDLLDGVLLGRGMLPDNPERGRSLAAAALIAPVVALDAIYAAEAGWPA